MSRRLSRPLHQKYFLVCAKHNISSLSAVLAIENYSLLNKGRTIRNEPSGCGGRIFSVHEFSKKPSCLEAFFGGEVGGGHDFSFLALTACRILF